VRGGSAVADNRDLLLGVDVGTTGVKSVLFSAEGTCAAMGQVEYPTRHPHPGWAEQDPEDWWRAVCGSIGQALSGAQNASGRVSAIAVSAQAPTLLPLDSEGRPLRPALIWMDRRAEGQAERLKGLLGGENIEGLTGNRCDPFYVAPKLLWYRENEPHLFARTALFAQINGYINYRLTGAWSLDPVHAALLLLRDWKTREWLPQMCGPCGVGPENFPPVLACHTQVGEVTGEAAAATGLAAGTPVMTGTVDGAAAALEAGAVEPGLAAEMTGTSSVLLMVNDSAASLPVFIGMPHALPGLSLLLGALATSGACLKWFRNQFGSPEVQAARDSGVDVYDLLTAKAAQVSEGSHGVVFLPYMMGERSPIWHTQARGVFFGLSLSTPREALIRSILEGTAFALRHNVEVAVTAGVAPSEIRSVGGGARSPVWCQIKADVLGLPIHVPRTSVGAAFGSAVIAGMGAGWYSEVRSMLRGTVEIQRSYFPRPGFRDLYTEQYLLFRRVYDHLRADFDQAAANHLLPA
jgi:xylulokinase